MTKFGKTSPRSRRLSEENQQVGKPLSIGNNVATIAVSPRLAMARDGRSARMAVVPEQDAPAFIKSTFSPHKGETSKDVSPLSFAGAYNVPNSSFITPAISSNALSPLPTNVDPCIGAHARGFSAASSLICASV
jgi:hypothetical protein